MENETAQVRILACFFFSFFFLFLSVYMWKCDKGFVHFLHIVAFSKINGPVLDNANRRY